MILNYCTCYRYFYINLLWKNCLDSFKTLGLESKIGLVVNSAVAYDQCPTSTGFYGPNIEILRLDILDDPKAGEAHSAASDATPYISESVHTSNHT